MGIKKTLFLFLLSLSVIGCVQKSELEKVQAENNNLRVQVSQLQQQVTELQQRLQQTGAQLTAASAELSRKPSMPVKVNFRRALMGPGYVAVFNTTIKQSFPVLVTVHSKALGTNRQITLNLSQNVASEVGHVEGAAIEIGDELTIENNNYEPLKVKFSQ